MFIVSIVQAAQPQTHSYEKKQPITNQTCIDCHQQSHQQWFESDHAKSMGLPTSENVLADFNNSEAKHYAQKAKFYQNNKQFFVDIAYDGESQTLPIKYTFGHYPLQQYLVETEKGRLQVLPFAWDSRDKEEGGQRWYHNYSNEEVKPNDRLHWKQPLQNWNGMCADCHSDGLKRHFNVERNQFASQFDNINVGCLSCHGDMTNHISKDNQNSSTYKKRNLATEVISNKHLTGQWLRGLDDKVASWQGATRDNSFMDACFACHSLRAPLTDGIEANKPLLDQFSPQFISAPNYHADGQIKEEVYVYGSFLQSKMYAAGVNCLDCHDKHTMKIKVKGNGLCLQCHSPQEYQVKTHHQHRDNSTGSQCVNCHMPTNRYMGVDDRRDHSFKIPRPHLSKAFDTPNACTSCHSDKNNDWAIANVTKWHGNVSELTENEMNFIRLQAGQSINLEQHLAILADESLPVITRATALQLLNQTTQLMTWAILAKYAKHEESLLRLASVSAASLIVPSDRVKLLKPLLVDKYKAIRVAAANALVSNEALLTGNELYLKAFKELTEFNDLSSWRGEGHLNQGLVKMAKNNSAGVEASFLAAIDVDPYMDAPYINLADLYRSQQNETKVKQLLLKGLRHLPKSASLHYSYGLHLVRVKALPTAIGHFKSAMEYDKTNSQYLYMYALGLDNLGKTHKGVAVLKQYLKDYQDQIQLKELGMYFGQKLQDKRIYDWFNR